jgi:hypothetical protein
MKNIHLLPTDNYSQLVNSTSKYGGLFLSKYYSPMKDMGDSYQNIYITSDEEIKKGDYMFDVSEMTVYECIGQGVSGYKIILTTDQDLIKDGVQAIDDEFLEWFVKNPSCEFVEVVKYDGYLHFKYMVIIPQEESKQECKPIHQQIIDAVGGEDRFREIAGIKPKQKTLEEAAEHNYPGGDVWTEEQALIRRLAFKNGAKWQQKRRYSEEQLFKILLDFVEFPHDHNEGRGSIINRFLKELKKK